MSASDLKVYYNSACPVCNAGIESQRGTMEKRDLRHGVEWIDIACNAAAIDALGLDINSVRHSLHVSQNGEMLVGADAFIALAGATPGQRWIAGLFGNTAIRPVTRFVYNRFADLLFWWNKKRGHW